MVVKNARFEDRLGGTDLPDESREVLEHLKKVYLWEDECIRDCYNSRAGVFSLFNTIKETRNFSKNLMYPENR